MESSRNSSSSELPERVAAALSPAVPPGAHLALGLSGGVDSVALLSILLELAPALRFSLRAVHVNHGISPNAGRWAEFCSDLCRKSQVPLQMETVDLTPYRSLGLEGAARQARHEVFARLEADFVVLAQHRDDQAETLLLRLLRGAGLRGLAAMSPSRSFPGSRARLLRPLLEVSRAEIEAYARLRGLDWVEDESNADTVRQRNFLRREVIPLLERQFPAASATIARAAAHLAEAQELLDAMARADLERCGDGAAVEIQSMRQLRESRADARVGLSVPGWDFLRHRGKLYLEPAGENVGPDFRESWNGENALPLLALGGVLKFKPEEGRGLSLAKLRQAPVTVRVRRGGERLRPDSRRPRRTLKNLFQERGIPPWRRDRLPFVYCGEELVSVPGIGEACEFRAARADAGLIVTWEPFG